MALKKRLKALLTFCFSVLGGPQFIKCNAANIASTCIDVITSIYESHFLSLAERRRGVTNEVRADHCDGEHGGGRCASKQLLLHSAKFRLFQLYILFSLAQQRQLPKLHGRHA